MKLENIDLFTWQGLLLRDSKIFFQYFEEALLESFVLNNMKLLNNLSMSKNVRQLRNDKKNENFL